MKGLSKGSIFVAAIAMIASAQAYAGSNSCLDKKLVQQIDSQIHINTKDKNQFNMCEASTNTYKMYETLSLVRTIKFNDGKLAQPYSQRILPNDFWGYFSKRANTTVDEDSCSDNVLAFVYGATNDGIVHICPYLYNERFTKYERAQVMLHEARHFEGFAHVTCTRGPRAGNPGQCDNSVDEKGSYAVTVESLTKMAMSAKDIDHTQKTMLKVLALTYANEVFNTPIQSRDLSAMYLISADNHGYLYSDKGLVEVPRIDNATVISRATSIAVFPTDKSDAYTADVFTPNLAASPAMGTFSAEYNSLPKDQRPNVIDILNLNYLGASITSHQIKSLRLTEKEQTTVNVPFEITAAYSGLEVGAPDTDSIYIVNKSNEMYRVQIGANHVFQTTQVQNVLDKLQSVTVFNDSRLALDTKGQVLAELNGGWTNFAPLRGKAFTRMTRTFLWDQYFEDGPNFSP